MIEAEEREHVLIPGVTTDRVQSSYWAMAVSHQVTNCLVTSFYTLQMPYKQELTEIVIRFADVLGHLIEAMSGQTWGSSKGSLGEVVAEGGKQSKVGGSFNRSWRRKRPDHLVRGHQLELEPYAVQWSSVCCF